MPKPKQITQKIQVNEDIEGIEMAGCDADDFLSFLSWVLKSFSCVTNCESGLLCLCV